MEISVGCQGLSQVADELFSDLKGQCVFSFMDDLVVYSPLLTDYEVHPHEVFYRL